MYHVFYKGRLIGIKIANLSTGSIPQTEESQPLQIVTLKHPKGTNLKAHVHTPKKRVTSRLQECMIIRKGKIKLSVYTQNGTLIEKVLLKKGELFLLVEGGIGIDFINDSEIYEIKNGPFKKDKILI